jgi:hypothetical protein
VVDCEAARKATDMPNIAVASAVSSVKAYPNPTTGIINILFNGDKEERYQLLITDISGKLLSRSDGKSAIGTNKRGLDLSSFSKGIYFINLRSDSRTEMVRIVIE